MVEKMGHPERDGDTWQADVKRDDPRYPRWVLLTRYRQQHLKFFLPQEAVPVLTNLRGETNTRWCAEWIDGKVACLAEARDEPELLEYLRRALPLAKPADW